MVLVTSSQIPIKTPGRREAQLYQHLAEGFYPHLKRAWF